jgi:phenylacetate-CoA ligase
MKHAPHITRSSAPERTLRECQLAQLRRFLGGTVLPFSAHYRRVFAEHGLAAGGISTWDDWARVPFTTKDDLVNTPEQPRKIRDFILIPDEKVLARRPATILRALVRGRAAVKRGFECEFRPVFMTSTTGRSADPIPFVFTQHDLDLLADTGRRVFEVCGADRGMRLVNSFPYAPHLAFWLTHYGATSFGVFMASTGGGKVMGTEGNLRMIRKVNPDVLIGMPTFVYHLLHQAAEEGVRCDKLRRLVLGGEKVPHGMRRKLRLLARELGAADPDILATYGFTEARTAWAECPCPPDAAPSGYHLHPDLGFIEIVDPDTGEVRPPGSPGEIVFTPLDGRGTVVLRYRTGDVTDGGVTFGACPYCARAVPRLTGHISRKSEVRALQIDKLKGTLVDFNQLEHVLDDAPAIGAWQLELRKRNDDPLELDELVLHVHKLNGGDCDQIASDLENRFVARTEIRPNRVVFHTAEELRRLQGVGTELKERRLVDHRPAAETPGITQPEAPAAPLTRPPGTLSPHPMRGEGRGEGSSGRHPVAKESPINRKAHLPTTETEDLAA